MPTELLDLRLFAFRALSDEDSDDDIEGATGGDEDDFDEDGEDLEDGEGEGADEEGDIER